MKCMHAQKSAKVAFSILALVWEERSWMDLGSDFASKEREEINFAP